MGVRNGAAARPRDQADPGYLGRGRLGAGRCGAGTQHRAAGRLPEATQIVTGGDGQSPEERLPALGLTLPAVTPPPAAYLPAGLTGAVVYPARHLPLAHRHP